MHYSEIEEAYRKLATKNEWGAQPNKAISVSKDLIIYALLIVIVILVLLEI